LCSNDAGADGIGSKSDIIGSLGSVIIDRGAVTGCIDARNAGFLTPADKISAIIKFFQDAVAQFGAGTETGTKYGHVGVIRSFFRDNFLDGFVSFQSLYGFTE